MAWQRMDSSHAELLRNAIVRVNEEFGCTAERDVRAGEFGPTDAKRDVCLPDRPVQRVMRTEMPLEEDCRNWPQFVREVMPLKAMLKVYSFPRLSS